MAPCPPRPAVASAGAGGCADPRRIARAADWRHEPCGRAALDSLARSRGPESIGGGQLLLHGMSLSVAADPGPPLAADRPQLAALVAEQVAGGGTARLVPMGLRGV